MYLFLAQSSFAMIFSVSLNTSSSSFNDNDFIEQRYILFIYTLIQQLTVDGRLLTVNRQLSTNLAVWLYIEFVKSPSSHKKKTNFVTL